MCGLTLAPDGSEDDLIHCFKVGEPCTAGREMLARARQREMAGVEEGELEEEKDDSEEEFENELVVEDDGGENDMEEGEDELDNFCDEVGEEDDDE